MPPFYFLTFAKVSISVSKTFGLKEVSVSVLKTFGLEKKSRYRSRKYLVSKKFSVSKILVPKKSLGISLDQIFWSRHSVYMGQSKTIFCVLGHFQHGINQPNEQPGDPTARLLMTSVNGQSFAIVGIDISFIEQKQKF